MVVLGARSVSPSLSFLAGAVALLLKRLGYPLMLNTLHRCFLSLLRLLWLSVTASALSVQMCWVVGSEVKADMCWVVGSEVKVPICMCSLAVHCRLRIEYATSVVHVSFPNSVPCSSGFQHKVFKVLHVKVGYHSSHW